MPDFLKRGTEIRPGVRIRKKTAFCDQWQIYLTSHETSVLAVSPILYKKWLEDNLLPDGLFFPEDQFYDCRVFEAKDNYMIASLKYGPFPDSSAQLEAFSISFSQAKENGRFDENKDAIYLEEYSMILPTGDQALEADVLYGHWITGGMDLGKDSFSQILKVMSWISKEKLLRCFSLAGLPVFDDQKNNDDGGEGDSTTIVIPKHDEDSLQNQERLIPDQNSSDGKQRISAQKGLFSLPGRPALEEFFRENIIDIVLHQDEYKRMGISFPGATVLYGPPGSGKTYAVERLAEYLGWERFDIDSGTIGSSFIHDTSKKISQVFRQAIDNAPSILVIDEMEAFLSERTGGVPSATHHMEEVAEFLRRIPEATQKGVLIFAMTNMLDTIDPAILRRGRFDHIIEVGFANKEEITSLLKVRFNTLPVEENIDIDGLSANLANRPMSDVSYVIKEAGRFAVKHGLDRINQECFDLAINKLPKKSVKPKIGF